MPAGAAQAQERVKETNIEVAVSGSLPEEVINAINSNGAEIEIMEDRTPAIVVEVVEEMREEDEEIYYIPLILPSTVEVINEEDGSKVTAKIDGNYLLIPVVEDEEMEIERVCISDFAVKEVKDDGRIVLVCEVNPLWKLIAGFVVLYGAYNAIVDIGTTHLSMYQGCRHGRTTLGIVEYGTPFEVEFPRFREPDRQISRFDVSILATDVDGETVKVYLVGTDTREHYYLGTLDRAGDGEQEWTSIRVPNSDESIVDWIIKQNDGLISIGFVMENRSRNAAINYVNIFIDW